MAFKSSFSLPHSDFLLYYPVPSLTPWLTGHFTSCVLIIKGRYVAFTELWPCVTERAAAVVSSCRLRDLGGFSQDFARPSVKKVTSEAAGTHIVITRYSTRYFTLKRQHCFCFSLPPPLSSDTECQKSFQMSLCCLLYDAKMQELLLWEETGSHAGAVSLLSKVLRCTHADGVCGRSEQQAAALPGRSAPRAGRVSVTSRLVPQQPQFEEFFFFLQTPILLTLTRATKGRFPLFTFLY